MATATVAKPQHVAPMDIDQYAHEDDVTFAPGAVGNKWNERTGWYPRSSVQAIMVAHNSADGKVESVELGDDAFVVKCQQVGQNPLEAVLGGYGGVKTGQNYDMLESNTWLLPYALRGNNVKILDTYEHLLHVLQANSWYNELVSTREVGENMGFTVYWTRTKFDPFVPRRGPVLAMPSLVTARRTGGEVALERNHGAVRIGHGFLGTRNGIRHFFESLLHLALGFAQAINFDKATAIATTGETFRRAAEKSSRIPQRTLAQYMEEQVEHWAWLQYDSVSQLPRMDTWMDAKLLAQQGSGDAIVISKQAAALVTKGVPSNVHYYKSARGGIQRLTGDLSQKMTIFGIPCYVMESFAFTGGVFVHPLARTVQIGGYVPMYDRSSVSSDGGKYVSDERTVQMTVMRGGDSADVTLKSAIDHCHLWDSDGGVKKPQSNIDEQFSEFTPEEFYGHFLWKRLEPGMRTRRVLRQDFIGEMPLQDPRTGGPVFGTASRYKVGESLWTAQPVANSGDAAYHDLMQILQMMKESAEATLDTDGVTEWIDSISGEIDGEKLKQGGVFPIGPNNDYAGMQMPPGLDTFEGLQALGRLATFTKAAGDDMFGEGATPPIISRNRNQLKAAQNFVTVWGQAISTIVNSLGNGCLVLEPRLKAKYARLPYYNNSASLAFDTAIWNGGLRAFIKGGRGGRGTSPAAPGGRVDVDAAKAAFIQTLREEIVARAVEGIPIEKLATEDVRRTILELDANLPVDVDEAGRLLNQVVGAARDATREQIEAWARGILAGAGGAATGGFAIPKDFDTSAYGIATSLRISNAMMQSILEKIVAGDDVPLMPASPDDPNRVITGDELRQIAAQPDLIEQYFPSGDNFMCRFEQSGLARALQAPQTDTQDILMSTIGNPEFVKTFAAQSEHPGNPVYNAMAQLINCTRMTKRVMQAMRESNVRVPLGFLAMRMHRLYMTHKSTKLLRDGFGGAAKKKGSAAVQDDAEQHLHLVTADMWTGWYADRPENVVDVMNSLVIEYIAGEDVTPVVNPELYEPHEDQYGGGSIIFIAVPYDWREVPENLIPQGNMQMLVHDFATTDAERRDLSYPTAPFYNDVFKWRMNGIGRQERIRGSEDVMIQYHEPFPAACRVECHKLWDPMTKQHTIVVRGNDFWKFDQTYTGCGIHRLGGCFLTRPERGNITIM